jgi:hypothetical protein
LESWNDLQALSKQREGDLQDIQRTIDHGLDNLIDNFLDKGNAIEVDPLKRERRKSSAASFKDSFKELPDIARQKSNPKADHSILSKIVNSFLF